MQSVRRRRARRPGFTMIELLTVIGIIVILMSILIPILRTIKRKGLEADTLNQINKIAAACQNYFQDFRAYPGPVPEIYIDGVGGPPGVNGGAAFVQQPSDVTSSTGTAHMKITSSENVVLGLLGGLFLNGSAVTYNVGPTVGNPAAPPCLVGKGPSSLAGLDPRQYPPYLDMVKSELATDPFGSFVSITNQDPVAPMTSGASPYLIPEFVDRFPNERAPSGLGKAIIYLRARTGGATICSFNDSQYYAMEMAMYWAGSTPGQPFPTIPDPNFNYQVLYINTGGMPDTRGDSFFQSPALNDGRTPRGKDAFIMISAGYDGLFGTKDDIIYGN